MTRTLSLKRETLQDLTPAELGAVVGGNTNISCLDYISCFPWQCVPTFGRDCIE